MQTNKWYAVNMRADKTAEVMIYEEIGAYGIGAKTFCEDFKAIDATAIDLRINSYGGEVFDGLAIYEAIKGHPATVAVHIDGIAASIASVIALAGDTVSIAENAYMMIHNPWNMAMGDAAELRKQADLLDKLGKTSADIYAAKTGKTADEMLAVMAAETWYNAEEALAAGLVDSITSGGEIKAEAARASMKFRKPPERLRTIAAMASEAEAKQKQADAEAMADALRIRNEIENEQAMFA